MDEEPKELSNPFSTGSGGAMFETRVQAFFASLMLTNGSSPYLPTWPVYKIKLQGRYSGYATDDAIIFVKDETTQREAKLIAQIKHALSITISDKMFAEVVQAHGVILGIQLYSTKPTTRSLWLTSYSMDFVMNSTILSKIREGLRPLG